MRKTLILAALLMFVASFAFADALPPVPAQAVKSEIKIVKITAGTEIPTCSGKVQEEPNPVAKRLADCLSRGKKLEESKKAEAVNDAKPKKVVARYRIVVDRPLEKLVTEFVRKPIHGVQKNLNDWRACRLDCKEAQLREEAKQLDKEERYLRRKAGKVNGCLSKLLLLEEASDYAARANDNTCARAALECRRANQHRRKQAWKAQDEELYPSGD